MTQRAPWRLARRDTAGTVAVDAVLSWIRTISLPDDVVHLDPGATGARRDIAPSWLRRPHGDVRFEHPSRPGARPVPVNDREDHAPPRFLIRAGRRRSEGPLPAIDPGWRPILELHDLLVLERDAPHGGERPLRLGLSADEAWAILAHARRSAERSLGGGGDDPSGPGDRSRVVQPGESRRLAQRVSVAVAVWTRGRLRGSVVLSPGPALWTAGRAARLACQDPRFPRPTAADLAESVFQVGFLHPPRVPLAREEVEAGEAYTDKALFVSEGTRSGAYLPEVFNVLATPIRRMQPLVERVAREKAGIEALGPRTRVEVCSMTDVVESSDRTRALTLDGPVAREEGASVRDRARRAGEAASAWLAAVQRPDGSLPLFVRPSRGDDHGTDVVRSAMTADAMTAFGTSVGSQEAVEAARRTLAWIDRSAPVWSSKGDVALATAIYRGKAALTLGDDAAVDVALRSVLPRLEGPDPGPLVLAHAASFLDRASWRHAAAAHKVDGLRRDLEDRFRRAIGAGGRGPVAEPASLAEWAELGAAFPHGSKVSREVRDWLRSWQLASGAFPSTTASDFAYARGTGKVFEVLALQPDESPGVLDRALAWLLSMQYRPDSAFFVPHEHWPRVLGGVRHDAFAQDAWIDAAGHLLLGVARLLGR